jgi:hypothetical protein
MAMTCEKCGQETYTIFFTKNVPHFICSLCKWIEREVAALLSQSQKSTLNDKLHGGLS